MPRGKAKQTSIKGFGFVYRPTYRLKSGEQRQSSTYWLYYTPRDAKTPVRKSSGTDDQATAYEMLVQLRAKYGRGELDTAGPERVTFGVLFDLLEADYDRHRFKSADQTRRVLKLHLRPRFGDMRVLDLRKRDVEAFRADILKDHKPATLNRMLSHWHRAMRLGMEEDPPLVLRIPAWLSQMPEDNVRTGTLSYEDYRRMRDLLPPHAALLLTIGYHLGMRSAEIRGLRWDQVDLEYMTIKLEAKQTKAKFARTAPIYGEEFQLIMEKAFNERDPSCPYVIQFRGKQVKAGIHGAWDRARKLAGIPGALAHDLRRTAATNMRRRGIDEATIMRIVGWRTPGLFLRYNIVGPEDSEKVGRVMGAWMDEQRAKVDARPKPQTM
jgi:integrase